MPKIQKYKTTTMQRVQNCVSLKYYLYTRGKCPPEKVLKLVNKFNVLYNTNLTKDQRYYRKKKGQSICQLFIYPHHKENYFMWWLLVTEGTGIIHEREHLKDTRRKHERLKWNDEFELRRLPKDKKTSPNDKELKPTWTWCFTKNNKQIWYQRINTAVRYKNKMLMRQALFSLSRMPGFRGIRITSFELARNFKTQWDRVMSDNEKGKAVSLWNKLTKHEKTNKQLPIRISYLRKQPDDLIELSAVANRMINGEKPFV